MPPSIEGGIVYQDQDIMGNPPYSGVIDAMMDNERITCVRCKFIDSTVIISMTWCGLRMNRPTADYCGEFKLHKKRPYISKKNIHILHPTYRGEYLNPRKHQHERRTKNFRRLEQTTQELRKYALRHKPR